MNRNESDRPSVKITRAKHYGMCFGVRDAVQLTQDIARSKPLTVLGELVHNPVVRERLHALGVKEGDLEQSGNADTETVVITAHGSANSHKEAWKRRGHRVVDTTCPLVKKAHRALESLIAAGYHPVVIGQEHHVEVRGLTGDYPQTAILLHPDEVANLPVATRYGVVAQTTQPIERVQSVCRAIEARFPAAEVRFADTVCQPTKDRQNALVELCANNDTIIVVGGRNSNNTAQLTARARAFGCQVWQVQQAGDLEPDWIEKSCRIGVTAGTSTLDETVDAVVRRLRRFAERKRRQARSTDIIRNDS